MPVGSKARLELNWFGLERWLDSIYINQAQAESQLEFLAWLIIELNLSWRVFYSVQFMSQSFGLNWFKFGL